MRDRREYCKQWKARNKTHVSEYNKRYIAENRGKVYLIKKAYQERNKEKIAEYMKDYNPIYYANNRIEIRGKASIYEKKYWKSERGKSVLRAYRHNRRAKLVGLTKEIVQTVYEENIKKYGTLTCDLCHAPVLFGEDSLEHFTPLSRGGNNEIANLGIAHNNKSLERCNSRKGKKTLEEYRAWL